MRTAFVNLEKTYITSGGVSLRAYCAETSLRLHRYGFLGLEIHVRCITPMFLDYRVPFTGVDLWLNGAMIARGELCLESHGQVCALFFKDAIPIGCGNNGDEKSYNWSISFNGADPDFDFSQIEIFWIFGEKYIDIKVGARTIPIFQYGNTDWNKHLPFQCKHDGIYTNELMLDEHGNSVSLRYSH